MKLGRLLSSSIQDELYEGILSEGDQTRNVNIRSINIFAVDFDLFMQPRKRVAHLCSLPIHPNLLQYLHFEFLIDSGEFGIGRPTFLIATEPTNGKWTLVEHELVKTTNCQFFTKMAALSSVGI